jgi:exonuclease SbcC
MIKSVILENFQSHVFSELEFHEGVNVITGSSDSGKSALIRGIYWLINNRPSGESFKNWKAKKSDQVAIELVTDKNKVAILRNDSKTSYIVNDGKPLEAIRTDVPSQVNDAINISEYNLQTQFDPYFLLQTSSGDIARKLNEYADIEVIDVLFHNIDSEVRKTNEAISNNKSDKQQKENELLEYQNLDDIKIIIDNISKNYEKSVETSSSLNLLNKSIESLESIISERESLKSILALDAKITSLINSIEETKALKEKQDILLNTIRSLEEIKTEINSEKDIVNLEPICISLLDKTIAYKNLSDRKNELNTILVSLDNIHRSRTLEENKKDKAMTEYVEWLAKEKKCPTCSSPINKLNLAHIKENL